MTSKQRTCLTIVSACLCLLMVGPVFAEEVTDLAEGCGAEAAIGYGARDNYSISSFL